MTNAVELVELNARYATGPMARTDLHAGGIFFCVVYCECLMFAPDGRVRRWCEVIDESRPFDNEHKALEATNIVGNYRLNSHGYLECRFVDLELTGLPCERDRRLLAFYGWRPEYGTHFSIVYRLTA